MIQELVEWYRAHCDGEWEHGDGITIETLDNPGWSVKITGASNNQSFNFEKEGEEHWLYITTTSSEFIGYGDESSLIEILAIATKWINKRIDQ